MDARGSCPSNRILLHIGYHKTATTWFQSELFSRPEFGFRPLSARILVHQAFCSPHPLAGSQESDIRQIVSEANEATAAGHYFVISHERLSGYPASGGFDSGLIAGRLKSCFPNARIFCLFREQRAMILSAWGQQVVDGGALSLGHFISPPEPHVRRMPLFDPVMYRYSHLLRHYRDLFGAENVLFLPYEAFRARPGSVLAGVAKLLESRALGQSAPTIAARMTTPNPSLTIPVLHLHRFLNANFARTQLSQGCVVDLGARPIRAVTRRIDRAIGRNLLGPLSSTLRRRAMRVVDGRFGEFFNDDNALLSRLTGQPLSEFGYAVGEQAT
jgi:hypothetical protein